MFNRVVLTKISEDYIVITVDNTDELIVSAEDLIDMLSLLLEEDRVDDDATRWLASKSLPLN